MPTTIQTVFKVLRAATKGMLPPAATLITQKYGKNPFLTLIGCILSLRTRDTVSFPIACQLFELAKKPQEMVNVPLATIEKTIHSVNFYKNKSRSIKQIAEILLAKYHGKVPNNVDELMSLPGVGLKTAHLVLAEAFDIPAICVDTHVHRITNRLGWISTKTVEETEQALRELLPKKHWIEVNKLLVMWGQNICIPLIPKCSICPIRPWCARVGVIKSQ